MYVVGTTLLASKKAEGRYTIRGVPSGPASVVLRLRAIRAAANTGEVG